jgi:hypothetical protein
MKRALVMLVMTSACACGPIQSQALISDADAQLDAATQAGAKKLAPYEYEAASRYLHKAREEVGVSQFVAASEYAERAKDEAAAAHRLALERSRAP